MNNEELTKAFFNKLNSMHFITVDQIPNIDLYMDQVTTFMDTHLSSTKRYEEDKVLTKTMINNYAKNRLLPAPVNKKYTQEHMVFLIFIYYLKNILSISDIQALLKPLTDISASQDSSQYAANIYSEIFSHCPEETYRLVKDITHKLNVASSSFSDESDEEKAYLQKFTYLCLLGFDIYVKKQLMESIIDDLSADAASQAESMKKKKASKASTKKTAKKSEENA